MNLGVGSCVCGTTHKVTFIDAELPFLGVNGSFVSTSLISSSSKASRQQIVAYVSVRNSGLVQVPKLQLARYKGHSISTGT